MYFEKFLSAYLFQITQQKLFDYLLFIYMQLNFNFLHNLQSIGKLSANQHAECSENEWTLCYFFHLGVLNGTGE